MVNGYFQKIVTTTNTRIKPSIKQQADNHVEQMLAQAYYDLFFFDNAAKDAFSIFEVCIDTGQCEHPWATIERIALLPGESVYFQADYSIFSKKFLASQIQACGVRFSTDKLTHMFKDGFNYFNYARSHPDFNSADVELLSALQERLGMGGLTTGVISHADVSANLAGFRLLQDIFNHQITRNQRTGMLSYHPINLCNYISDDFDETHNTNTFVAATKKIKALKKAIKHTQNKHINLQEADLIRQRQLHFTRPTFFEKLKVILQIIVLCIIIDDYQLTVSLYADNKPRATLMPYFSFKKSTGDAQ